MKLLENFEIIQVEEERIYIILNTLNAEVLLLNSVERDIIKRWSESDFIEIKDQFENNIYSELKKFGFIVSDSEEELNIINRYMTEGEQINTFSKSNLTAATFILSYKCNFACPYCYEEAANNSFNDIMTPCQVDKIFDIYNNKIENIALYGGEPLLLENRDIIQYIIQKAPQSNYSITTNGYYLLEYFDILSKLNVNHIMVTLDGYKDKHNKTRKLLSGEGSYDKIMQGIELYLKNNIPVKIRMNINNNNIDECLKIRSDFKIKFKNMYEKKILTFEMQPVFQLSIQNKNDLNNRINFLDIKSNNNKYSDNILLLSASPIVKKILFKNNVKFMPKYNNCDAETNRRFYDPMGNIYSCILAVKNNSGRVGTYYPNYCLTKNSFLERNIKSLKKCFNCKFKFLCGGGCANEVLTSDTLSKSNCKNIINEIYVQLPNIVRSLIDEKTDFNN